MATTRARPAAAKPAAKPAAKRSRTAAIASGLSEEPLAARRVLRRFRVVFNAVKAHFQQVERRSGVGGAQLWALSVVASQPGIGVGELARAMDVHQTTASNLVRALVKQDMLLPSRHSSDRRLVQLTLLPAGQKALRKAPGPFGGVLPEALARLDAATLERLDRDLARVITLLQADERAEGIPLAQM